MGASQSLGEGGVEMDSHCLSYQRPLGLTSSPERTCCSFSSYPGLLKPVPGGADGECRDPDACRGLEGAEGFSLEKYGRLQKAGKPGSGGAGAAF